MALQLTLPCPQVGIVDVALHELHLAFLPARGRSTATHEQLAPRLHNLAAQLLLRGVDMQAIVTIGDDHLPGRTCTVGGLLPSQAAVHHVGIRQHGGEILRQLTSLAGGRHTQFANLERAGILPVAVTHLLQPLCTTRNGRAHEPQLFVFLCRERQATQQHPCK